MEKCRLDRFLSAQLNITRTDAKKMLRRENVCVDGVRMSDAGFLFDPNVSTVTVGGETVEYREHLYIMMNKPEGVISASDGGSRQEKTVVDLVPACWRRPGLFPAGRLDKDTTGFVLITDDGAFAHRILSPVKHVPKTYHVWLRDPVPASVPTLFAAGLTLDGERLQAASLRRLSSDALIYEIVLTQGKYHQIKRMFASVGNAVIKLDRVAIGDVLLDPTLLPGECRLMRDYEVLSLIKA